MATSIIKTDEIRRLNDQVLMSDGALTGNVVFPAGHVIQTQFNNGIANAHELSASGTAQTSSFLSDSITTTVANSKILVMYSSYGSHTQSATRGSVWLQRTIGNVITQINQSTMISFWGNHSSNSGNIYSPIHINYIDSPNVAAGTQITYSSRFVRSSGSNAFYYVHEFWLYQTLLQEIMP